MLYRLILDVQFNNKMGPIACRIISVITSLTKIFAICCFVQGMYSIYPSSLGVITLFMMVNRVCMGLYRCSSFFSKASKCSVRIQWRYSEASVGLQCQGQDRSVQSIFTRVVFL